MLSQTVLRQLGEINRRHARSAAQTSPTSQPVDLTPKPVETAGVETAGVETAGVGTTSRLPAGYEVVNAAGKHWRIDELIETLWPESERFLDRTAAAVEEARQESTIHPELSRLAKSFPSSALYLDLETCGFAGSMVFLVGVLYRHHDRLILAQLFARNYAEERAMLQSLWEIADGQEVLVTFNGKSFDWPVVHDRSTLHHLGRDPRQPSKGMGQVDRVTGQLLHRDQPRPELFHCDLLHHCRRRWRTKLPNCKLQTLEHFVCGRRRSGDIAGRDIPAAYHDYVRSNDAWQMRSVLHHNALDLITLLQLSLRVMQ